MKKFIVRLLIWLGAFVAILVCAAPLGLYWVGLNAVDSMPIPPASIASTEEQADVWVRVRGQGVPQIRELNPYSVLYSVASGAPQDAGTLAAWQVASEHLLAHRRFMGMSWWHLSGAALTIWLTRNWSTEQILSQASVVMRKDQAN